MSECPGGCLLVIVGSTVLTTDGVADELIADEIEKHQPRLVVSGGAPGVDTSAQLVCLALNVPFQPFEPLFRRWDGFGGFKDRNTRMALAAECLVSIRAKQSKTFGSGWTAKFAEARGVRVTRHTLDLLEVAP